MIKSVLNDIELAELAAFAANPTLINAVKKVLLFGVYFTGTMKPGEAAPNPTVNAALSLVAQAVTLNASNEQLGIDLRALWEGVQMVQGGFDRLAKFAVKEPAVGDKSNAGR